jgi:hypothetical protein
MAALAPALEAIPAWSWSSSRSPSIAGTHSSSRRIWREAHARRVEALYHAARESGALVSREAAGSAFDRAWQRHQELWMTGIASGAREVATRAMHELVAVEGAVETVERLARGRPGRTCL